MSTKHIILTMLEIEPMTGYEVAQNLQISLVPFWSATNSQVYPALKKLESEGLVRGAEEIRGEKMPRTLYHLTAAGKRELSAWLNEPITYLPTREPFKLWASFLDSIPLDVALVTIDEHIRRLEEQAQAIEAAGESIARGEHPLIRRRAQVTPPQHMKRIRQARSLLYHELAAQARFEVESAKRVRRYALELGRLEQEV